MRHLITLDDVSPGEMETIFALTADLKTKFGQGEREPLLPGRVMALVFEKQSLRTRVSFESGMTHLGGRSLVLGDEAGFGKRESLADFTRVLSEMVDVIVARTKSHQTVVDMAAHSRCSVINGLTDESHPCQALADLYTLREHVPGGELRGSKMAWVGDGNNVARSLAAGCAKVGVRLVLASPPGYELDAGILQAIRDQNPDASIEVTSDPVAAVEGAAAVYTDVWTSMGQEAENAKRLKDFAPFQVNAELMSKAPAEAVFMHCLPARRGEEVTDEVIDSSQSVVVQQAANRLHAQKGALVWLLGSHADG